MKQSEVIKSYLNGEQIWTLDHASGKYRPVPAYVEGSGLQFSGDCKVYNYNPDDSVYLISDEVSGAVLGCALTLNALGIFMREEKIVHPEKEPTITAIRKLDREVCCV